VTENLKCDIIVIMQDINCFQTEEMAAANANRKDPILFSKMDILEQARILGRIFVTRFDRDLHEVVTDLITPDMPEEEILI